MDSTNKPLCQAGSFLHCKPGKIFLGHILDLRAQHRSQNKVIPIFCWMNLIDLYKIMIMF